MGVNSSIEGSNPSFSVRRSPDGCGAMTLGVLVVPTAPALDAEDGCKSREDGDGKQHPGHDQSPLRCRGVLRPASCTAVRFFGIAPILPSPTRFSPLNRISNHRRTDRQNSR